jgi:hypothetical protein
MIYHFFIFSNRYLISRQFMSHLSSYALHSSNFKVYYNSLKLLDVMETLLFLTKNLS